MGKIIIISVVIAVIAIGGYLASPLFYETEVNEPLPVALDKIQSGLTVEEFVNMNDSDRERLVTMMPMRVRNMIMDETSKAISHVSEDMSEIMANAQLQIQKEPETIKTGTFEGLTGHEAQGIAKIIQAGEESFLRFENFEITNGPDLRVYVTPNGDVKDGIHLEKLKGSRGSQNYPLDNIDIDFYNTVVIYCQPFGVPFGQAELD